MDNPPDFCICIGDDASDEGCYPRYVRSGGYRVGLGLTWRAAIHGRFGIAPPRHLTAQPPNRSTNSPTYQLTNPPSLTTPHHDSRVKRFAEQIDKSSTYFTATVGKKPSAADNYVNDIGDVIEMLESMTKVRQRP